MRLSMSQRLLHQAWFRWSCGTDRSSIDFDQATFGVSRLPAVPAPRNKLYLLRHHNIFRIPPDRLRLAEAMDFLWFSFSALA
jgi:hypothetical protein